MELNEIQTIVTTQKQEVINSILEDFDFEKMHKIMKFLNWKWLDKEQSKVPSQIKLYRCAERLLNVAIDDIDDTEDHFAATGGLCVRARIDEEDKELCASLIFEAVEYSVNMY